MNDNGFSADVSKYYKPILDWLFIVALIWLVWNTYIVHPTIEHIVLTSQLRDIFTWKNNSAKNVSHYMTAPIVTVFLSFLL